MPSSLSSGLRLRLPPLGLSKQGSQIPAFVYGTAWKKDRTQDLVLTALQSGFTAVDTAAQPRHYNEQLVGSALSQILDRRILAREDVYVSLFRILH